MQRGPQTYEETRPSLGQPKHLQVQVYRSSPQEGASEVEISELVLSLQLLQPQQGGEALACVETGQALGGRRGELWEEEVVVNTSGQGQEKEDSGKDRRSWRRERGGGRETGGIWKWVPGCHRM